MASSGGGGGSSNKLDSRLHCQVDNRNPFPRGVRQTLLFRKFIGHKFLRRRLPLVPLDERVNAATRAAGGDALRAAAPPCR